jgi:hypothetical protein
MKKFSFAIMGILAVLMVLTVSCKKWIDPDINKDPSKPSDVSVNLILPAAEAGIGYTAGGDLKYAACIWMQQMAGGARQPLVFDNYIYTQSDVNNVWVWDLYAGPMKDCQVIIQKATTEGSPYYVGIAKVLMAYQLGNVTDLWGDAPYSAAFQGADNLTPKYDTQQEIYATLNTLLNDAITAFGTSAIDNNKIPGGDDLIFGGDLSKWTMTAYALKARYALNLCKRNPTTAYTDALSALTNAFASNADDFEFYFGTASNEYNPLYQFNDQNTGDIAAGAYLVDSMLAHNDPRLPLLIDTAGGATGLVAGHGGHGSLIGPYYASTNSPVPFISYVECKFIEAEARLQEQPPDAAGAALAFNDAVKASLAKFGVSDAAWEAIYANENAGTISLAKIMQQKYYALCYQLQVYNDWRRTGLPVLQRASTGVLTEIPRRYPYPTSEVEYNTSNVPSATLLTKVWWDN